MDAGDWFDLVLVVGCLVMIALGLASIGIGAGWW